MIKQLLLLCLALLFSSFQLLHAAPTQAEQALLEKIAKQTFNYFWEEANPENGLIRDATTNQNTSISVVGFGLAGLCIAVDNNWISRKAAYKRAVTTLRSFSPTAVRGHKTRVANEYGHPYHWVSTFDGSWPNMEGIFSTDTAVFIAGVITVGEYFKGTEVETLANAIYKKVDWSWFYNAKEDGLHLGWTPKSGHFGVYQMNEVGVLGTLLAISSPTHPIPTSSWFTLGHRYFNTTYKEFDYFGDAAAYTHQWPFCFIDPRLSKDFFADYAQNNREFALAGRQWCIDHRGEGYGPNIWGLNVAQGPEKYGNYGAPVIDNAPLFYNGQDNDGTIAPTAAIGFTPFTPEKSLAFINHIYSTYGDRIFKKYGFTDSFNLSVDYFSSNHLGINQGSTLLMIDNYLNGTVWKYFSKNKYIKAGLDKAGFVGLIDNFDHTRHSFAYAKWSSKTKNINFGSSKDFFKEGKKSLAIDYHGKAKVFNLSINPKRSQFSGYRYLGIWQSGITATKVSLINTKQRVHKLKQVAKINDGAWDLVYYKLPKLNSRPIKTLSLSIFPKPDNKSTMVYLDYLHLSNKQFLKMPAGPNYVEAIPGKHSGEVILSWQIVASGMPHAGYQIKYATTPFVNKKQFDQETRTIDYHDIMKPGQYQTTITSLEPARNYYFAICSLNAIYRSSKIATATIKTPSKETIIFDFDPKELATKTLNDWEYFQSTGDKLEVIYIPAKNGYARELNYVSDDSGQAWFGLKKSIEGRMKKSHRFNVNIKGFGLSTMLEFKLITASGAVFGKKIEFVPSDNKWHDLTIAANELTYWWGGDGNTALDYIDQIELVFTTDIPGRGRIAVNHLRARWK